MAAGKKLIQLSKQEKQEILGKAKDVRKALVNEARDYKAKAKELESKKSAKSTRTAEYFRRAANMLDERAKKYTQRAVTEMFGKNSAITEEIALEAIMLKQLSKGSQAGAVARRILQQKQDETVKSDSYVSARFYGGLVSIWYDETLSEEEQRKAYYHRDKKINQFFKKRNLLEVMQMLEEKLGIDFLEALSEPYKYQEMVAAINAYVSGMNNE